MKMKKEQILEFIRARGDDEHAAKAEKELPDEGFDLDPIDDEGILAQYGVSPEDLNDESV
jgi:hypothetical protein